MKSVANSEPFLKPVDPVQFPAYKDYISCPMDLQVAVHHDQWSRGHSLSLPYMMTYILQQVKKKPNPPFQSMERNIRRKQYGSTEAMLADCKWILHNCIIFNSPSRCCRAKS